MTGDLQATILKGHGRNAAAHVFVHHDGLDRAAIDALVGAIGVTSAADQQAAAAAWRADPTVVTPPVHVVAFSARGLRALGHDQTTLPGADAFWAGMGARAEHLADPPPDEQGDWGRDADLVVVLADDDERVLLADVDRITDALPGAAVHVEWGRTIWGPDTGSVTFEPFGYADGVSDPVLGADDGNRWSSPSAIWWRPDFPVEQVLARWQGAPGTGDPGSFLVFRKLAQDVAAFHAEVAEAAAATATTAAGAGARIVGRYQDGTPLAEVTPGTWNDFTFALDPDGDRCPYTAHIRAVNPRTTAERHRLVARRGIPYRTDDESGLLFLAFMADIEDQFEWMQRRANDLGDRIAGQGSGRDLVTLRGGQYLYAPPMSFFS